MDQGFLWSNPEKVQITHIPTLSKYAKELFINIGLTDHKREWYRRAGKEVIRISMQVSICRGIYQSKFEKAQSHRKCLWKKTSGKQPKKEKKEKKRHWLKYKDFQCQRRAVLQVGR